MLTPLSQNSLSISPAPRASASPSLRFGASSKDFTKPFSPYPTQDASPVAVEKKSSLFRRAMSRMAMGTKAASAYFTPSDWKAHNYVIPGSLPGDVLFGTLLGVVLSAPSLFVGAVATIPAAIGTMIAFTLLYRFLSACGGRQNSPAGFVMA